MRNRRWSRSYTKCTAGRVTAQVSKRSDTEEQVREPLIHRWCQWSALGQPHSLVKEKGKHWKKTDCSQSWHTVCIVHLALWCYVTLQPFLHVNLLYTRPMLNYTILSFVVFHSVLRMDAEEIPHEFIYIDETGFNLGKAWRRGRNTTGHRAIILVPGQRGGNITLSVAISENGMFCYMFCCDYDEQDRCYKRPKWVSYFGWLGSPLSGSCSE